MTKPKTLPLLFCATAIVLITGCGSSCSATGPRSVDPFEFNLVMDKPAFGRREVVSGEFRVRNMSSQPLELFFGACDEMKLSVSGVGDVKWSGADGCGATTHNRTMAAGETAIYHITWRQKDPMGTLVPSGSYNLTARFVPGKINNQSSANQWVNYVSNPVRIVISSV